MRILPDGCCDLIWLGDALVVAGPDTSARLVRRPASAAAASGVRFVPGAARSALGCTGESLVDAVVPAGAVIGVREAAELTDRLAAAPPARHAWILRTWSSTGPRAVDLRMPAVIAATRALADNPAVRMTVLADRLGYSERQLRRLVRAEVGYSPKLLARVLRLQATLSAGRQRRDATLAELAAAGGFADQAHLAHECRDLARTTAAQLFGR